MTDNEIRKGIQSIMDIKTLQPYKVDMFLGFIKQQQREAFATGKAQAYREMFSVICELAGKDKAAQAAKEAQAADE